MSTSETLRALADYAEKFGEEYVAIRPVRARLIADVLEAASKFEREYLNQFGDELGARDLRVMNDLQVRYLQADFALREALYENSPNDDSEESA